MTDGHAMPYDAETERAILGSILLDNSVFTVALDAGLTGSDFFSAGNQFIWEAMLALRHRDESIDALTLCAELGRSGALQRIGGRARISALIDGLPNAANVAHYAAIVKRHAASRHLIRACDETIDEARVADQAPAALSERLRARLDAICVTGVVHSGLEIRSLASILEDPEALRPPTVVVPRLAWAGRVTLLAAREKGGKSTTATASAAAVSRGGSWLDAVTATGSVIWLRFDTLRSRLSAAYKGINVLVLREGSKDWFWKATIKELDADEVALDIHHIFPRDWCKKQGIGRDRYDSILNKTPISYKANRKMGAEAPSRYLPRIQQEKQVALGDAEMDELLASHALSPVLLREDAFDDFQADRRSRLSRLVETAMGKPVAQVSEVEDYEDEDG